MTLEFLTHPLCRRLTTALLHFIWQGALLAGGLELTLRLFRSLSVRSRHLASLLTLSLMVASFIATFVYAGVNDDAPGNGSSVVAADAAMQSDSVQLTNGVAGRDEAPKGSNVEWLNSLRWAQPYLILVWLVGVSFFGMRLLLGGVSQMWLRGHRKSLPAGVVSRALTIARRLGVAAAGRVFASDRVSEAMAVGFWKPVVLLPASWVTGLPAAMLEAVIAHELAHIRRWDLWAVLFQRVAETLLFYHPAVWWVSRRVTFERELCCDELAVAATGRPLDYARALQMVATMAWEPASPMLATTFTGGRQMSLLIRVRSVLGMSCASRSGLVWPACAIALAVPIGISVVSAGVISPGPAQEKIPATSAVKAVALDGEGGGKPGPRDGEGGAKRGPRDGEGGVKGPRDGEGGAKRGPRDGEGGVKGPRDGEGGAKNGGDGAGSSVARTGNDKKMHRIFDAYDKNNDGYVSFDEWLSMIADGASRVAQQRERFDAVDTNHDNKVTYEEFVASRPEGNGSKSAKGEKGSAKRGDGDGGAKSGPRDGEGSARKGPRDGEGGAKSGPRDGEGGARKGPRDGESNQKPKDGN